MHGMDPDNILRDNPGSAVFSRHAESLAREGRIGEAIDILRRGVDANPYHAPGHSVLAEILLQLDSREEAVERLLSAVRLDPQSPRDLFRLGAFFRDSDPEKADSFLRPARTYAPGFDETAEFGNIRISAEDRAALKAERSPVEEIPDEGHAVSPAADGDSGAFDGGDTEEDEFAALFESLSTGPSVESGDAVPGGDNPVTGEAEDAGYAVSAGAQPDDTPEVETVSPAEQPGRGVFDAPELRQVTEEHSSFEVIGEYQEEEPETAGGSLPDSAGDGDFADDGLSADDGPQEPVVPLLSIEEEEEYNLANFGFESPGGGEVPVLSAEERSELLALTGPRKDTVPPGDSPGEPEYGLAGLTLEDIETPAAETVLPSDAGGSGAVAAPDIAEVLEVPPDTGGGTSYLDILSAWNLPQEPVPAGDGEDDFPKDVPAENPESGAWSLEDVPGGDDAGVAEDETSESPVPAPPVGLYFTDFPAGNLFDVDLPPEAAPLTEEQSALIKDFLEDEAPSPALPDVPAQPSPVTADGREPAAHAFVVPGLPGESVQYSELDSALAAYGFSVPGFSDDFLASPPAPQNIPSASSPVEIKVADESLDDLISAYRNVLDASPAHSAHPAPQAPPVISAPSPQPAPPSPVPPEAPAAPVPPPSSKHVPQAEPAAVHSPGRGGSYTATMAEIYSSQGLVARAIEIYEALLAETPENDRYRSRLAELKQIYEQNTDAP